MDIGVTEDMEIVRQIMTLPEIWERANDGLDEKDFIPRCDELSCWLLVKEEEKIIGVILLNHETSATLNIHPYMRKEFYKLGREMMKTFYKWMLINLPESIIKLNSTIPECFGRVYNFAKKVGFKDEGFDRDSYVKDGQIYGQYNLGITRQEVEKWAT